MDAHDVLTSAIGNIALLGATIGAFAALRRGQPSQNVKDGMCQRCKGSGVQECSLCYGRGSIAQPGYVNVANAMHRRMCLRCGGMKTQACTVCGGAHEPNARGLLMPPLKRRLLQASSAISEQRVTTRRRLEKRDEDDYIEF